MGSFSKPTVSVVIPVYNGGSNFRKCLESIMDTSPSPLETIVVADGDTDGSGDLAESFVDKVVRTHAPGGPARARNLGAHEARGEILFFVDADVTISRDAIGQVQSAFKKDLDLAAVFGSYDDEPFEKNFLSQYKNLLHHYVHQAGREEASTFWGACGAVRQEVFLELGGFDETYDRPSIEDIDLGYRLKKAGHRIRLVKGLQVKHLKRWSVFSLLTADVFYRAIPWTLLILDEGEFVDDLNLKLSSRISVISVYMLLLSMLFAGYAPWLLGLAAFFALVLLALNRDLYCFFWRKRGLPFALKTIPWHWLYFFYSGIAFTIGLAKFKIKRLLS